MSACLYVEGGGNSKENLIRCREGFRKLFEHSGFKQKMPRLSACGGRQNAFHDFKTALSNPRLGFVAMLIDSEDPIDDIERTWEHLNKRDDWARPVGAMDEQVFFMTTSMETWIAADRATLREYFHGELQEIALPPLFDLEKRNRHDIFEKLVHATRNCSNTYEKGTRSFDLLGKLNPSVLNNLPSFARMIRILREKLG